jgi:hypothetical protein
MRRASVSDGASGFSSAMARTPCATASSTSGSRTRHGVAKQSASGVSEVSMASASV